MADSCTKNLVDCRMALPLQEWIQSAEAVRRCRSWRSCRTHDVCRYIRPLWEWIRNAEAVEEVQIKQELPMTHVDVYCPRRSGSGTRRRWRRCRSWRSYP